MENEKQKAHEPKVMGYVWTYQVNLGTGRTLSVQGNFALDAAKEDMDAELDKITAVAERQQAAAMIAPAEEEVAKLEVLRDDAIKQLNSLEEQTSGQKNVPTQTRQNITTLRSNLDNTNLRIKLQKDVLESHRKKVA